MVLWCLQDEDEVDQGTMVRTGTGDTGTIRAASSVSGTMVERQGTMQSRLGTMVINSDDEEQEDEDGDADGTMKSEHCSLLSTRGRRASTVASDTVLEWQLLI